MNQDEWKEHLDAQRGKPLCELIPGIPLFKYQHIERMDKPDVKGLLDGEVIVMNKLDGANLSVAKGIIASRKNVISRNGEPKAGFKGAVEYVLAHAGIQKLLDGRNFSRKWILRGEWAIRHSLTYDANTYGHLYVFDVQTWDGQYVHPDVYIPILEAHGIKYIRVLARLSHPKPDELTALSQGPDEFGAAQKEGIVVKRYDFVSQYGRTVWGKVVSADFRVKNKLAFHVSKKEDPELRLARVVTAQFVLKVIHKIEDAKYGKDFAGSSESDMNPGPEHKAVIRDMPQILGRVWYDVIQEELWSFLKQERVDLFSFKKARKYVETAARETALAYFNGTPTEPGL